MPLSPYLFRRAAGRGQDGVPSAPARPGLLARADRAFSTWWHARTRPDRRAAWTELRRAGSELRAELAASSGPAWLLAQLQARIADRTCAALTQQLQEETGAVDRAGLEARIAYAVAHGDIDPSAGIRGAE